MKELREWRKKLDGRYSKAEREGVERDTARYYSDFE